MDVRGKAKQVLERLSRADDLVITREDIIAIELEAAFKAGLNKAAHYVADEAGQSTHLTDEIRRLPCCF